MLPAVAGLRELTAGREPAIEWTRMKKPEQPMRRRRSDGTVYVDGERP